MLRGVRVRGTSRKKLRSRDSRALQSVGCAECRPSTRDLSANQRSPATIFTTFFADQPQLKVIVIYVEAVSNLETFKATCRMARATGKHIVALKLVEKPLGLLLIEAPARRAENPPV